MSYYTYTPIIYTAYGSTVGVPSDSYTYGWVFDDGGIGSGASLSHTWTTASDHSATVTATSINTGVSASASKTITVVSLPVPSWTNAVTPRAGAWSSVAYGAGLFVAVLGGTTFITSPDGINWTTQTVANGDYRKIKFLNGMFIVVGGASLVRTSTTGLSGSWVTPATIPATNYGLGGVAYGNGVYVVVGGAMSFTRVFTSPDANIWTEQFANYPGSWVDVVFGGGKFVAGNSQGGTSECMRYSTNGVTWNTVSVTGTLGAFIGVTDLAYGGSTYVGLTSLSNTPTVTSTDGINWVGTTAAADPFMYGYSYGYGSVLYHDGTNFWRSGYNPAGLAYKIQSSADGVTWVNPTNGTGSGTFELHAMAYGNSMFAMVGLNNQKRFS
jgi:hypothetical protein